MGKREEREPLTEEVTVTAQEDEIDLLGSKNEVADYLRMHVNTLDKYLRKYPFEESGRPGKIMGRWRVPKGDVDRWFRWVQDQELRHPDARRLRPEEAPGLQWIKGR